jgi:hypothetical protein
MVNRVFVQRVLLGVACLGPLPELQAQDVAIAVAPAQISVAINACRVRSDCAAAVLALLEDLLRANPATPLATVIGSIAAVVAEQSNSAIGLQTTFDVAANAAALNALASYARSKNLPDLSTTVSAVALVVANRLPIDLGAIASGTAAGLLDQQASPT